MSDIELQFIEGKSRKFWRATQEGTQFVVTYGRIGSEGQSVTKAFDSESDCLAAMNKLADSKRKKGYFDVGGAAAANQEPVEVAPPPAGPREVKLQKNGGELVVTLAMDGDQLVTTIAEKCKNEAAARSLLDRIERAMREDGYQLAL